MAAAKEAGSGSKGEFVRDDRYLTTRITRDGRDGFPGRAGSLSTGGRPRLPLGQSRDHRPPVAGSREVISLGVCGPTHDERSWTFDLDPGQVDPVLGIKRLQQAFFARDPDYPLGITVPAMVDVPTGQVVTNDYAQLTLDLSTEWTEFHREGAPQLYPEALRARDRRGQ